MELGEKVVNMSNTEKENDGIPVEASQRGLGEER